MAGRQGGNRCCALWCRNHQLSGEHLRFHSFPRDKRLEKWAAYANRPDILTKPPEKLRQFRLCSEHFTKDTLFVTGSSRLKKNALPTVPVAEPRLKFLVPPEFYVGPMNNEQVSSDEHSDSDSPVEEEDGEFSRPTRTERSMVHSSADCAEDPKSGRLIFLRPAPRDADPAEVPKAHVFTEGKPREKTSGDVESTSVWKDHCYIHAEAQASRRTRRGLFCLPRPKPTRLGLRNRKTLLSREERRRQTRLPMPGPEIDYDTVIPEPLEVPLTAEENVLLGVTCGPEMRDEETNGGDGFSSSRGSSPFSGQGMGCFSDDEEYGPSTKTVSLQTEESGARVSTYSTLLCLFTRDGAATQVEHSPDESPCAEAPGDSVKAPTHWPISYFVY